MSFFRNKNTKLTAFIFLIVGVTLVFSVKSYAEEIDDKIHKMQSDPIEVAKLSRRLALEFKYEELKAISCDNEDLLKRINTFSEHSKLIIKQFKLYGIDYHSDVSYDFSNLKFKLLKESRDKAIVKVSGTYKQIISGLENKTFDVNTQVYLDRMNGLYHYCGGQLISND